MSTTGKLFGSNLERVSLHAKIVELERELETRKRVYPKWIKLGRLEQGTAEIRILIVEAILADYYRQNVEAHRDRTT